MDCTALTVVAQPALPAELTATLELAADFAKASKAKATQDAYESDFRIFEAWCTARGLSALPATAESLCAFGANRVGVLKTERSRRWPFISRPPIWALWAAARTNRMYR